MRVPGDEGEVVGMGKTRLVSAFLKVQKPCQPELTHTVFQEPAEQC